MIRVRLRTVPPLAILALGWGVLALYAFPGQMSWDSFESLHYARHGFYSDVEPPAIAGMWSLLEIFVAGPTGMFVVQSIAFSLGMFGVLRRTFNDRAAAWVASALVVFPPILLPMAVIWGHSLMAGFLLLGTAGLLDERPRLRIAGLCAFVLAVALRPSGAAAALPLVVLLFEPPRLVGIRRYAVAFAAWLTIVLVACAANWLLTDRETHRWQAERAMHDIAGTLRYSPPIADAELAPLLAPTGLHADHDLQAQIRKRYRSRDTLSLTGEGRLWDPQALPDEALPESRYQALVAARAKLAWDHPLAFLRHRMHVMKRVLGFVERDRAFAVLGRHPVGTELTLGIGVPTHASDLQEAMTEAAQALAKHTPLLVPWVYLVIALLLLPFAWRQRDAVAILASGLAAEAVLCGIASDNSYRQSHWLVVCTCIGAVIVMVRRAKR